MSRFSQAVITAFLLCAVCARAQNWTTISAANITDLNQNKLAAGQLCFLGTDQNDNPINFNVGGGGQVLRRAFCSPVAAGAVTAFTVPNPVNTTPAGVFYRVTVKDSSTGQEVLRYTQVTFSGGAFNFDAYAPVSIGAFTPPTGTATPGNLTVNGNLNVTGSFTGAVLGFSNLSGTIGANQNATALNAQTGTSYAMLDSDRGKLVTLNNASAVSVSLPQAGSGAQCVAGWYARLESLGAGVVTITPATSTIDGAASLTLRQFGGVVIISDGANYFTVRGRVVSAADLSNGTTGTSGSPVVLATSPALTTPNIGAATGASLDLTGGGSSGPALGTIANKTRIDISGTSGSEFRFLGVSNNFTGVTIQRIVTAGNQPSPCSITGAGASASCTFILGGTDLQGIVKITANGSGTSQNGALTLTLSSALGANVAICDLRALRTNAPWDLKAVFQQTNYSTSAPSFLWDNNGVLLVAGNSYELSFRCIGQ
jgi:hypothetical protein